MNKRLTVRAAVALVAGAALALAAPLAASAHVRIDPDTAVPGGYSYISFRVPTESATASTVGLTIDLPTTTPFTSVSYQAVPGWTAKITTSTLATPVKIDGTTVTEAPTAVTFTATGTGIAPGQFGVFTLSLGIVPKTGQVTMPTTQTYSDGTVVTWNEPTPASGDEPENPAPTLYIENAPPAGDPSLSNNVSVTSTPASAPATGTTTDLDIIAIVIGIVGLIVGFAGLIVAVIAVTRRRSAA